MKKNDVKQMKPEQEPAEESERKADACGQNRMKLRRKLFTGVFLALVIILLLFWYGGSRGKNGRQADTGSMPVSAASKTAVSVKDNTESTPGAAVTDKAPAASGTGTDNRAQASPPGETAKQPVQSEEKPVRIRKDLDADKPMIALTFDDGPYGPVTKRIIKVLDKYKGRGTFFVVGNRVSSYKKVLRKAYRKGNLIGNHTYEHKNLTELSAKQVRKQIKKTSKAVKKVTGKGTSLVRPAYGAVNKTVRKNVKAPMINWNVDSEDWASRNKKKILKRCDNLKDGDIVLMHDIYASTAEAVEKLVPKYAKKGYQFVTVEELFYYKGIKLKKGKLYFHAGKEEK